MCQPEEIVVRKVNADGEPLEGDANIVGEVWARPSTVKDRLEVEKLMKAKYAHLDGEMEKLVSTGLLGVRIITDPAMTEGDLIDGDLGLISLMVSAAARHYSVDRSVELKK